jgi:hypothetical protein
MDQVEEVEIVQVIVDLADGIPEEAEILADLVEVEEIESLKRCMMLFVMSAEKSVKFHSNLQEINLFYAVIVLKKAEVQEGAEEKDLQNN